LIETLFFETVGCTHEFYCSLLALEWYMWYTNGRNRLMCTKIRDTLRTISQSQSLEKGSLS
jgi:hypothetical protein